MSPFLEHALSTIALFEHLQIKCDRPHQPNHLLTSHQFRASQEISFLLGAIAQINSPTKLISVTERYNKEVKNFQAS